MTAKVILLIVALAVLAVAFAKRPTWRELDNYTFESFVQDFNLKLSADSSEFSMRKVLFLAELARVKAHNAKNLSWKEGVNKFSAMTVAEKKAFFGRSKSVKQNHVPKTLMASSSPMQSVSSLPENVDWRKADIVTAVKDQGYCGSCWAFASTAVVESAVAKATGLLFDLSVQQMTACAPNPDKCGGTGGCYGATAEIAFDYVAKNGGLLEEYQYGYANYYGAANTCAVPPSNPVAKIQGYVQLPTNNYTAVINAAATEGPIAISVDASSWGAYESGIFNGCNQANPDINHAVVLVGYGATEEGKKYWLVRNSWSPTWGEKGYIRVARTDDEDALCGTDTHPQDGVACEGQTEPQKVCGTCGIIFDVAYPTGASL